MAVRARAVALHRSRLDGRRAGGRRRRRHGREPAATTRCQPGRAGHTDEGCRRHDDRSNPGFSSSGVWTGAGGGPEKTILLGAARANHRRFAVTVCYIRDRRDDAFDVAQRARGPRPRLRGDHRAPFASIQDRSRWGVEVDEPGTRTAAPASGSSTDDPRGRAHRDEVSHRRRSGPGRFFTISGERRPVEEIRPPGGGAAPRSRPPPPAGDRRVVAREQYRRGRRGRAAGRPLSVGGPLEQDGGVRVELDRLLSCRRPRAGAG